MTVFDDFINSFAETTSSATSLVPFVLYAIVIGLVIFGGYLVARWLQKRQHYKSKGLPLNPVRISWEKRYSGLEGYLSKMELFTDEVFEQLELQEEVKINSDILKQLRNEGRLNTYFLNVSDEQDTDDNFNDVYIISPTRLEECGWFDTKGKRYLYGIGERIRRQNLFFLETSTKYTIVNADGDEEDWWVVSPKMDGKTKEFVGFKGNKSFETLQHSFQTIVLEGGKKLSTEVSFSKKLAEALAQNQMYKQKAKLFEQLHGERISQMIAGNIKEARWKMGLTRHPYIVMTKEQFEKQTGLNMVWMAVSGLITGIMGFLMPDLISSINQDSAMMLGWIIGIVLSSLMFKLASDQQKKKELVDEQEKRDL